MKTRHILRLISIIMFVVAVVFIFCALACPTLGKTIYIGDFAFDAGAWRVCYAIYAAIMFVLFIASFLVRKN